MSARPRLIARPGADHTSPFQPFCRRIVLPAVPVQKGTFFSGRRVSQTQRAGEHPASRNIEKGEDCLWVEYRYPAQADIFRSGDQPKRVDSHNGGILQGFRHCPAP